MESYLVYQLSRLALGVCRLLPRASATRLLNILASLTYGLDPKHRHIARVNLTIAFPELSDAERDRIARKSFQNTAQNLLEISRLPLLRPENISSLVQYDPELGLNNFHEAQARGQGILYLTGHFSAWELLPAAHALYGYPLRFVTRPLDNLRLERLMFALREVAGNVVISKKNSARQILEALKSGDSVGILMDQNTSLEEGVFVDLFGVPAATSTGLAILALRTGATVLPGYLTPMSQGRYTIKFLPPVDIVRTGDTNRDVRLNTQSLNHTLERIIREQPESWLWGHQRWKNQPPENPPDIYKLSIEELREFLKRKQVRP